MVLRIENNISTKVVIGQSTVRIIYCSGIECSNERKWIFCCMCMVAERYNHNRLLMIRFC